MRRRMRSMVRGLLLGLLGLGSLGLVGCRGAGTACAGKKSGTCRSPVQGAGDAVRTVVERAADEGKSRADTVRDMVVRDLADIQERIERGLTGPALALALAEEAALRRKLAELDREVREAVSTPEGAGSIGDLPRALAAAWNALVPGRLGYLPAVCRNLAARARGRSRRVVGVVEEATAEIEAVQRDLLREANRLDLQGNLARLGEVRGRARNLENDREVRGQDIQVLRDELDRARADVRALEQRGDRAIGGGAFGIQLAVDESGASILDAARLRVAELEGRIAEGREVRQGMDRAGDRVREIVREAEEGVRHATLRILEGQEAALRAACTRIRTCLERPGLADDEVAFLRAWDRWLGDEIKGIRGLIRQVPARAA